MTDSGRIGAGVAAYSIGGCAALRGGGVGLAGSLAGGGAVYLAGGSETQVTAGATFGGLGVCALGGVPGVIAGGAVIGAYNVGEMAYWAANGTWNDGLYGYARAFYQTGYNFGGYYGISQ